MLVLPTYCVSIDKQKALRRDCIYYIEIVLEIGVAGVHLNSTCTVMILKHTNVPA